MSCKSKPLMQFWRPIAFNALLEYSVNEDTVRTIDFDELVVAVQVVPVRTTGHGHSQ